MLRNVDQVDWSVWIQRIHFNWAVPKGWWTDLETDEPKERDFSELCMLIVTELAEAMEGIRKGCMDDHLPERKMAEVEIADAVIRLLDMAGGFGFKIQTSLPPMSEPMATTQGGYLLYIVELVCELNRTQTSKRSFVAGYFVQKCINFCADNGYDLMSAIEEKLAYNHNREDHKLENRKAEGGKKV